MKPGRGKGERNIHCDHYDECLSVAAQENWKSFNCEDCPLFRGATKEVSAMTEKKENTRICEDCKEKPTISPKHPLCASCMARRSKQGREKEKGIGQAEILDSGPNIELVLRFGKHGYLLKEIEKLAEEEVRPVDLQVIYMLKKYLSNREVVKSI